MNWHAPLCQNEGLALKPMTLKIMLDSVQENNHHDSLAGKGQNGNDCSLIMELQRHFFLLSLVNKCQGSYCQWLLLLTGVGVYFSQLLLSKVGNNKLQLL